MNPFPYDALWNLYISTRTKNTRKKRKPQNKNPALLHKNKVKNPQTWVFL